MSFDNICNLKPSLSFPYSLKLNPIFQHRIRSIQSSVTCHVTIPLLGFLKFGRLCSNCAQTTKPSTVHYQLPAIDHSLTSDIIKRIAVSCPTNQGRPTIVRSHMHPHILHSFSVPRTTHNNSGCICSLPINELFCRRSCPHRSITFRAPSPFVCITVISPVKPTLRSLLVCLHHCSKHLHCRLCLLLCAFIGPSGLFNFF